MLGDCKYVGDGLAEPGLLATYESEGRTHKMDAMTPGSTLRRASVVLALILVITACNSTPPLTHGPRMATDQTLRVLLDDQPQTLDPGQTQYPYETAVLRAISEPLLKPTADLMGVTPAAAQTYDVAANGLVYIFHLRTDAQYWDGTPVRAQDFVYAWQRLIDPRLAAPNETFFAAAVLNGDKVSVLDPQRDATRLDAAVASLGLTAIDDRTFQVTLSHPDPAFIWLAAMPAGAPIKQDVVARYGDKWAAAPTSLVTNGPFMLKEFVTGDHVTVVRNDHYWGQKPTLTSIEFRVVNDGAVALDRYRNGDLDVIDVQPGQVAAVVGDSKLKAELVKTPALTVFWVAFRVNVPPMNNIKVRQAIAYAIDRQAFVDQLFQGEGMPAPSFIPNGMRGYSSDLVGAQQFDVAKARAALAASGKTAAQLSAVKLSYDQSSDFGKATAKFIHDQLKANLGVDLKLEALDTNTLSSRLATGAFQIAGPLGWTADYPDPADWYGNFLMTSSNNFPLYQNPQYDSLVNAAATDMQSSRRDQEYQQAQRILVSDAPVAFLAQSVSWNLVRQYVKGVITTSADEWPGALFPSSIYIVQH
jgi:oligopeptide transport system substrate-binding protein